MCHCHNTFQQKVSGHPGQFPCTRKVEYSDDQMYNTTRSTRSTRTFMMLCLSCESIKCDTLPTSNGPLYMSAIFGATATVASQYAIHAYDRRTSSVSSRRILVLLGQRLHSVSFRATSEIARNLRGRHFMLWVCLEYLVLFYKLK